MPMKDWQFTSHDGTFVVHSLDPELFESEDVWEARLRKVGYFWAAIPEVAGPPFAMVPEFINDASFWKLAAKPFQTFSLNSDFAFEVAFLRVALEPTDCVEIAVVAVKNNAVHSALFAVANCFEDSPLVVIG